MNRFISFEGKIALRKKPVNRRAVRGLASRAPLLRALARAPWHGAAALPRVGMTKRRALRGYKGAHGDAPGKTLSVCYLHYARALGDAAR